MSDMQTHHQDRLSRAPDSRSHDIQAVLSKSNSLNRELLEKAYAAIENAEWSQAIWAFSLLDMVEAPTVLLLDYADCFCNVGRISEARQILDSASQDASISETIKRVEQLNDNLSQQTLAIFEPGWYLARYGIDIEARYAFAHYQQVGHKNRWIPSRYISIDWYRTTYPDIAIANTDPLEHYVEYGANEGRDPNELFDTRWYLTTYQDVGANKWNPLAHYILVGRSRGYFPNPIFDVSWYLAKYPDIKQAGVDPLIHYIEFGASELRDPSPYFSTKWYLTNNPDVKESGINPLNHYLHHGWRELRNPNEMFDARFYEQRYLGNLESRIDPLAHYIHIGWRHGNWPSADFDPQYYRSNYSDVLEAEDPYLHYLSVGGGRATNERAAVIQRTRASLIQRKRTTDWFTINRVTPARRLALERRLHTDISPWPDDLQTLVFALENIDCVSFDIFDTLICRRVGQPSNVFVLTEIASRAIGVCDRDFVAKRMEAELLARASSGEQEVTLAQIYSQLAGIMDISPDAIQKIMAIETDLEINVCQPRHFGIRLYQAAAKLKKRLFLVSDTYLPETVVQNILQRANLIQHDKLFVSSTHGATKHFGHIFELISNFANVPNSRFLHIGDNAHSDYAVPRQRGIRALRIKSAHEFLQSETIRTWAQSKPTFHKHWKCIIAGIVETLTSRDVTSNRLSRTEIALRSLGYEGLAPVLLGFSQYVAQMAKKYGYQRLYFASRDGFYFKEAYDRICKFDRSLPPSQYLLSSRAVSRLASIKDMNDIWNVARIDHFPMTIANLITARFRLDKDKLASLFYQHNIPIENLELGVRSDSDSEDLRFVLNSISAAILEKARATRDAYLRYLQSIGLIGTSRCIVDIGYRGTTQLTIGELSRSKPGGIYFATWPEAAELIPKGFQLNSFNLAKKSIDDPLVAYVQLFELLLSATHGSLLDISMDDGTAKPIVAPPNLNHYTLRALNIIRHAAFEVIDQAAEICQQLNEETFPTGRDCIQPLLDHLRSPSLAFVEGMSRHKFEDNFGGDKRWLALSTENQPACWAEGAALISKLAAIDDSDTNPIVLPSEYDRFDDEGTYPGTTVTDTQ